MAYGTINVPGIIKEEIRQFSGSSVAVTGITLNKTELSLDMGETDIITAIIKPANADNQNVIWTSSDTNVATVMDGVVSALTAGKVTITAKTDDGNFTASCSLKVIDPSVITLNDSDEIGVRFVLGASDTALQRCLKKDNVEYMGDSNNDVYIGTQKILGFSVNADGSFNSLYNDAPIWGEMERVTLNGQVMVRVPKYYIKREEKDGYLYTWVCKTKKTGYRCAAIFLKADGVTENDYYYIGAYESGSASPGQSVSGAAYTAAGHTITECRSAAKAIGDGWGITPIAEVGDFWQVLLPIEFGTRDVQSVAAGVVSIVDPPIDSNFNNPPYRTGMCDNVSNLHGIYIAYPGDGPWGNYNNQTGANNGANPFVWHGIENPYGCIEKWIDGLTFKDGVCYAANNRAKFATDDVSDYTAVNYTVTTDYYYVKTLGYDENLPYCQLPTEVTSTSNTYYSDYWETPYTSGFACVSFGGYYGYGGDAGVWCFYVAYTSTDGAGSRLSYSPV